MSIFLKSKSQKKQKLMNYKNAIVNAIIVIGEGTKFPETICFVACNIKVLDKVLIQEIQKKLRICRLPIF